MNVVMVPTGPPARSLEWQGEYLVDPVGGFRRWRADGGTAEREQEVSITYGGLVDCVAVSPTGRHRVLYGRRGTKALVLEGHKVLREVNRSRLNAEDYDYPIALGRLPDGREVLAHCPEDAGRIRIEDTATGEILADQPDPGHTYFHSRLAFSPDGRFLLVNGWFWHPEATVEIHDVAAAIADARSLDANLLRTEADGGVWRGEVVSACWLGPDRIAVLETTSSFEEASLEDPDPDDDIEHAGCDTLAVLDVNAKLHARNRIGVTPGLLVACDDLVANLHTQPSLLDPATGRLITTWPGLAAGDTGLCYGVRSSDRPAFAYEARSRRLALAQPGHLAVIDIEER